MWSDSFTNAQAPLKHENLVNLVGGCWNDGPEKLALVLEFCSKGTLEGLVNDNANKKKAERDLSWTQPLFTITVGIAEVFAHFHHDCGDPLIHRE